MQGQVLSQLSQIDLPTSISGTSPFPILGVFAGIFHFYLNFDRTFCKQTVKTLIRQGVLDLHCLPMSLNMDARLIWVKLFCHLSRLSSVVLCVKSCRHYLLACGYLLC